MERGAKIVLVLISLMAVGVFLATAWLFLIQKHYTVLLEVPCDPETSTCFYRDCSIEGECPDNGLETFRLFSIQGNEYAQCSDDTCATECTQQTLACEETVCGDTEGDQCKGPEDIVPVVEAPSE